MKRLEKKITFIDLFSGCGGLSEGFLSSEYFKAVVHVEWELPMVKTLRNRLVKKWNYSEKEALKKVVHFDIQKVDELLYGNWSQKSKLLYESSNDAYIVKNGISKLISDVKIDVVIGGPPCQAYSIHGRATASDSMQNDYRNYLFESFVTVVKTVQPKIFVFENVPGILSAKPGGVNITSRIYKAFKDIGYEILQPNSLNNAVFNAVNYNVAQNRKRVIIIGVKLNSKYTLSNCYSSISNEHSTENSLTVMEAIGNFPSIYPLKKPIKISNKNISHICQDNKLSQHYPRYNNLRDINIFKIWVRDNMNKLTAKEKIEFYKKQTGKITHYCKYRSLEWNKPSPTIVAHLYKDGLMFIHPDSKQARSITVREAATLMSFPLDYEFLGSIASCYKMIGNAVPVSFAKSIANAIYKVLIEKKK